MWKKEEIKEREKKKTHTQIHWRIMFMRTALEFCMVVVGNDPSMCLKRQPLLLHVNVCAGERSCMCVCLCIDLFSLFFWTSFFFHSAFKFPLLLGDSFTLPQQ